MPKLQYQKGYEVNDVSPLPHYFEEIYGHTIGIKQNGPRGDKNYFWYSKDGNGAAYYEVTEQKKSADSTYKYLIHSKNQKKYFQQIKKIISDVEKYIGIVESQDLSNLSAEKLILLINQGWMLDAQVFSLYLISQPYRMQKLENEVRNELRKRVATSKIDYYLAGLTASGAPTKNTLEERDWAELIISSQKVIQGPINVKKLKEQHQVIAKKIIWHYEKYKILSLGDGNWLFDSDLELQRFIKDLKKPKTYFVKRIEEIREFPKKTLQHRNTLIKQLYLPQQTIDIINFLTEMAHVRYMMRVEGFIPLIYALTTTIDELAPRCGYSLEGQYGFMTHIEYAKMLQRMQPVVSRAQLEKRMGKHKEYLLRINNGQIEYYYGTSAQKKFQTLKPPIDLTLIDELSGVVAEQGEIEASVTVYQWGDDIQTALKNIKKHPILIAGQTRPSMMPIIRESKGIITDEGGVTSHAAIVARELKIPAVINTENATKVFKTGDKVLLDANNGVVRKIA